MKKYLIFPLGVLLTIVTVFSFLFYGTGIPEKTYKEPVLVNATQISVDTKGDIYILNNFFKQVLVYDERGHFKYAIRVGDFFGGSLTILTEEDILCVYNFRSSEVSKYKDGGFISKEKSERYQRYLEYFSWTDSNKNYYELKNTLGYSKIIKIPLKGEDVVFNITKFGNWLLYSIMKLMIPVSFITFFIGAGVLIVSSLTQSYR